MQTEKPSQTVQDAQDLASAARDAATDAYVGAVNAVLDLALDATDIKGWAYPRGDGMVLVIPYLSEDAVSAAIEAVRESFDREILAAVPAAGGIQ